MAKRTNPSRARQLLFDDAWNAGYDLSSHVGARLRSSRFRGVQRAQAHGRSHGDDGRCRRGTSLVVLRVLGVASRAWHRSARGLSVGALRARGPPRPSAFTDAAGMERGDLQRRGQRLSAAGRVARVSLAARAGGFVELGSSRASDSRDVVRCAATGRRGQWVPRDVVRCASSCGRVARISGDFIRCVSIAGGVRAFSGELLRRGRGPLRREGPWRLCTTRGAASCRSDAPSRTFVSPGSLRVRHRRCAFSALCPYTRPVQWEGMGQNPCRLAASSSSPSLCLCSRAVVTRAQRAALRPNRRSTPRCLLRTAARALETTRQALGSRPMAGCSSITEPDQGMTPIYDFISSATKTHRHDDVRARPTRRSPASSRRPRRRGSPSASSSTRTSRSRTTRRRTTRSAPAACRSTGPNPTYAATHQKTITVDRDDLGDHDAEPRARGLPDEPRLRGHHDRRRRRRGDRDDVRRRLRERLDHAADRRRPRVEPDELASPRWSGIISGAKTLAPRRERGDERRRRSSPRS